MNKRGFTVLELATVATFAGLLLIIGFLQKANMDAMHRDEQRKEAINAMHYALEEGIFAEKKYYPEKISEANLKMMDPQLFTDPMGVNLGEAESDYTYSPANCENGRCKEYTLRAKLEKEQEYVKKNR